MRRARRLSFVLAEVLMAMAVLAAFIAATVGIQRSVRVRQQEVLAKCDSLMAARRLLSVEGLFARDGRFQSSLPSRLAIRLDESQRTIRQFDYNGLPSLRIVGVADGPSGAAGYEVVLPASSDGKRP